MSDVRFEMKFRRFSLDD